MMPRLKRFAIAMCVTCSGMLAGCESSLLQPDVGLLEQSPPYLYSDVDWAQVLSANVRNGLVHYRRLSEDREALLRYYALLSSTGPSTTPDQFPQRQQAMAYWINAYNALVLLAVLEHYPISTVYDIELPRLHFGYHFIVDGQVRDLASVEQQVLAASGGDVRVLFTLCSAAMGTPRLRDEPYRANILDRQLTEAASAALDNPDLLRIDHASQSIFVWQEIFRRQEAFLDYWRTRRRVETAFLFNVLLELASPQQRRALQSAVGYQIREMPFDRRLNDASPPSPATRAE